MFMDVTTKSELEGCWGQLVGTLHGRKGSQLELLGAEKIGSGKTRTRW